jgi:molybdopterin synthase sulfur carrier subunit
MKVLYFAWLREAAGRSEEDVVPPSSVTTVAQLIEWLRDRGGGPAEALRELRAVRVAVDQTYVALDHPLAGAREVAFFPPVTGG